MSQPMYDGNHEWSSVLQSPAGHLESCSKCGIFRLTTLSNQFFMRQWNEQVSRCSFQPTVAA